MWRIGCFFVVLALVFGAALSVISAFAWHLAPALAGRPGLALPLAGVAVAITVAAAGLLAGRLVRRTFAPIGDVMAAADRVAQGDYGVRVPERGVPESRRLAGAFNQMTRRLEENDLQRRNLLADIAHELRTPLSIVRGNVEGMLDGLYPRDDAHLAPIVEQTAVMARLLDDLRTLSLAEAGVLPLHREAVDCGAFVAEVNAGFAPEAARRGIHLTSDVSIPGTMRIDPVRIREVLGNLVANAIRYTPSGGAISVLARCGEDSADFSVADTGPGIAPDQLPRIFDRFTKSADSGGSGLGLAIAKSLVEAHGGSISAESAPGSGTTIRFSLPSHGGNGE